MNMVNNTITKLNTFSIYYTKYMFTNVLQTENFFLFQLNKQTKNLKKKLNIS